MTPSKKKSSPTPVLSTKSQPDPRASQSRAERLAAGKALRERVPLMSHAQWTPPANRRDPVDLLEESNRGRLPDLVPIRYGRMLRTPFTFLRGSAALMAYDLASATPTTDLRVQACGDCHLLNFGLFATPERNLVFDINDFDETLPAPWEWDVKRLAASFAVAGRDRGLSREESRAAAVACVRSYRERLRQYSEMSPLDVWYDRLDYQAIIAMAPDAKMKHLREQIANKARLHVTEHLLPKVVSVVGGQPRFVDQPPVLFHVSEAGFEEKVQQGLSDYGASLSDERRTLLERYQYADAAIKVVGIGSVGTRCYVVLAFGKDGHPLILQVKEAGPSVLAPYAGNSQYDNQGQRVVMGQRLMQSSSDIFLGWARERGDQPRDFYVRQLRDMKMSCPVEQISGVQLKLYAEICGWTLARGHAKSGDAVTISGYLGKTDAFDQALGSFAMAYAKQTEQDHAKLVDAVRTGRLRALIEEAV